MSCGRLAFPSPLFCLQSTSRRARKVSPSSLDPAAIARSLISFRCAVCTAVAASNTLGSSGKAAGLWAARMDGRSVASNPGDMPLMRAMVLANPKSPLKLQHVPVPQPGPGQVRVKVAACAVCRTDLHVVSNSAAHLTLFQKPKEYISGAHLKNCAGSCAPLHTVNSPFREDRLPKLDAP